MESWLSDPLVHQVILAVLGLTLLIVLVRALRVAVLAQTTEDRTRYRLRKVFTYGTYVLAALLLGFVFSDRVQQFSVTIGVASAGVAFALQEVIVSVAGWLAITLAGYYKVGDRIKLGGVRGEVIDIGMLRTTVMELGDWIDGDLYNGRVVRIANSFIFKGPVFNYSGEFPFLWDEIKIPIKYGSDYHAARAIIQEAGNSLLGDYSERYYAAWGRLAQRFVIEAQELAPTVTISADHNWVEFTLRYAVEFNQRRLVHDRLSWSILESIDKTAGRVGIAGATLNIEKLVVSSMPPMTVRVEPDSLDIGRDQ